MSSGKLRGNFLSNATQFERVIPKLREYLTLSLPLFTQKCCAFVLCFPQAVRWRESSLQPQERETFRFTNILKHLIRE